MITADQTASLPDAARKTVQDVVAEYETQQTPEAHCAKDADKLECLIQAVEYKDAGYTRVQGWIDSSRNNLRTDQHAESPTPCAHLPSLGGVAEHPPSRLRSAPVAQSVGQQIAARNLGVIRFSRPNGS